MPVGDHPWRHWVALGDSITEGFGMDPVDGVEHLPWAERVARALARGEPGFRFTNLGYRRLEAAQVAQSQLERALALSPDLVSIAAGCNDLLRPDFSREQVERDLEPLYAAFARTGATVFTFTYMNLPASGLLPEDGARWTQARMEALHAAIRSLAGEYGAHVVDLWSDPEGSRPEFWSRDLQHANAAGQAHTAERTIDALGEIGRSRQPVRR